MRVIPRTRRGRIASLVALLGASVLGGYVGSHTWQARRARQEAGRLTPIEDLLVARGWTSAELEPLLSAAKQLPDDTAIIHDLPLADGHTATLRVSARDKTVRLMSITLVNGELLLARDVEPCSTTRDDLNEAVAKYLQPAAGDLPDTPS